YDGEPEGLPDLTRDARLAALHALHVGDRRDGLVEPAEGLRTGGEDRDGDDIELELLLEELLIEIVAAAEVHPPHEVRVVHAEGAAGTAGEEHRRLVLAGPVAAPG